MFDLNQDLKSEEEEVVPPTNRKRSAAGTLVVNKNKQKAAAAEKSDEEMEDDDEDEEGPTQQLVGNPSAEDSSAEPFWFTYKYKPLLGVLPVGNFGQEGPEDSTAVVKSGDGVQEEYRELVVIERPYWEVPQGPRYRGGKNLYENLR